MKPEFVCNFSQLSCPDKREQELHESWSSNACATLVGRQTRAQLSLVVTRAQLSLVAKRVRKSRWSSNACATLVGDQTRAQLSLVVKRVRNSRWSSNTCATLVNCYLDWGFTSIFRKISSHSKQQIWVTSIRSSYVMITPC